MAQSRGGPWAYCKLNAVHEQLSQNGDSLDAAKLTDCELEIASALGMASADSKLVALAKQMQDDVRRRKGSAVAITIDVKHISAGPMAGRWPKRQIFGSITHNPANAPSRLSARLKIRGPRPS